MQKLEIVYVENGEQFLRENSEQFYLMQKTDFMNAVSRFEYRANMMSLQQNVFLVTKKFVTKSPIFRH